MTLDPVARELIDRIVAVSTPVEQLDPGSARLESEERIRRVASATARRELRSVEQVLIPGPGGPVAARVYRDSVEPGLPAVIFFHGGGWVLCDLESHDGLCRLLAAETGAVVVSVDYRRAPEDPFPAGVDDAYASASWVADHADEVGVDPVRLAVAGDSSGANLAIAVTRLAKQRHGPRIAAQLLVYPITDHRFDTASYEEFAEGHYLTRSAMRWYWGHYLTEGVDGNDPLASPLRADDLSGLPPALVITAECDPLRDEGEAYAQRLRSAGVPVTLMRAAGMFHGFFSLGGSLTAAREANSQAVSFLRRALALDHSVGSDRRSKPG